MWRVIGASVQGTAHQKMDVLCQDAQQSRVLPDGTLLIAVADGAGSSARSQVGAQRAVEQSLDALTFALDQRRPGTDDEWQRMILGAFGKARESLLQLADDEDAPLQLFATTLTCVVATDGWLAVGRLGDGAIVAQMMDGSSWASGRPRRGEYANETYFLTMPEAVDAVEVQTAPQAARTIAVTTDGLLRLALKLPDYEPHTPFFQPLLAFAAEATDEQQANAQLADFLASERVCARTDDDKTLVLAVRTDVAPALAPSAELETGTA